MTEPMRIHRALARAGVASRRHAETLIAEGRVTVNGGVARLGQTVDPNRDRVQVDGKEIALEAAASKWYVLNKPAGVMTTRRDPEGRRTVFEMVPEVPGLTYVGRLDFLTEGVLLMTNDGEGANRLTHPSSEVERVYVATVRGNAKGAADQARQGVELEDGMVKPAWVNVHPMENRRWMFEIAIREGRTREIRRLCAALGLEVERLVRSILPDDQIQIGRFQGVPGRNQLLDDVRWVGGKRHGSAERPLLILSDLSMGGPLEDEGRVAVYEWDEYLRRAVGGLRPLRILVPRSRARWPVPFRRHRMLFEWSRRLTLSEIRRHISIGHGY